LQANSLFAFTADAGSMNGDLQAGCLFGSKTDVLSSKYIKGGFAGALIKKKIKFSSYIGKFRVVQLQSHI
jgi:hypothetical protein